MSKDKPIPNWIDLAMLRLKVKLGLISKEDQFRAIAGSRSNLLEQLPTAARLDVQHVEHLSNELMSVETMKDWGKWFALGQELSTALQDLTAKYGAQLPPETVNKLNYISGMDQLGYRPSASRVWGFMLSPFQAFTYFYENHWAVKSSVECIITEVTHDGFSLIHGKRVPQKRVREVKQMIDDLNIWELRLDLLKDYLVYGNALVLPHFDVFGNLTKLEKLTMDRAMPIWSKMRETLLGFDYWMGWAQVPYRIDRLLHLKDKSLKNPQIGLPPLCCLMVDLEADVGASQLNNTVMYKGCMVGALISLNDPEMAGGAASIGNQTYRKRLQAEIMGTWSGVKAGNSILVSNYVKDVHKLNNLSDYDGAFLKFREKVAVMVATVLKIPPEKINLNRSSSLQYAAASLEDSVNAGFDRALAAYMTVIDKFINTHILKGLLGVDDVEIVANGRYGSMNLNSARAGKIATETGPLFDVNELRTIFYGAAPLPLGEIRGREVIDNSKPRPKEDMAAAVRYSSEDSTSTGPDNPNSIRSRYRHLELQMAEVEEQLERMAA